MISIAIPCYEYHGYGVEVLEHSFNKLEQQIFKDFDVIISDASVNYEIEALCKKWENKLELYYFRNHRGRGRVAPNENYVIYACDGDLIKLLDQDDYLYDEFSLERIVEAFDDSVNWLATAYMHTYDRINLFKYHLPSWRPDIQVCNTIGTLSCITLRRVPNIPKLDENLTYYHDCDFYKRFADLYGLPKIIDSVNVINYLWNQSVTSTITQETIDQEVNYINKKYESN